MKKRLGVVKVHSAIDLITNSSTELFCVVEGSDEYTIQDVIDKVMEEMGCRCVEEIYVENYEKWDDDKGDYVYPENQYAIYYEQHTPPCKVILKRLSELLTIVEE